ncbi:hypothetical protein MNB_SV-15-405 [hydrothermal vent metagenome]|uniref:Uncharacterized protein n=1 Tax=hydrothermal vent metagenome TaxID=652676 RepID=A0A1W1EIU8_9ZZZZ
MKKLIGLTILTTLFLYSENNSSIEQNLTQAQIELQKQIEREKGFAKDGTFLKGEDYDLSYAEVNRSTLDNIPLIEPDYDFDMDDVYSD